jgi:alcohol dehydrogenase (cytochrome c)
MKFLKPVICLVILAALTIPGMVAATDWPLVAYDPSYSRNSPQTVIGANNVNQLQVKWIFNTNYPVEDPPLIVGNTAYIQNNAVQVFAVDLTTGLNKWKYDPNVVYTGGLLPRATSSHGMTYNNGILYAPTGPNGTIVALDANTGAKIWETPPIGTGPAYRESAPPIFWNNIIIGGSALGDEPPFGIAQRGTVSGIDMTSGKILWQTNLTTGEWVTTSPNASMNGGATTWTGGAIDADTGIVYLPIGNPSPDFIPDVRPGQNKYSNEVIAVNLTDGTIIWDTPFIAQGTVLPNVTALPDGHDWDCSWGTNLVTVDMGNGPQKVVIGHDKRGDVMAMDAANGTPLWWVNVIYTQNLGQNPVPQGTDVVWPGPGAGVEAFTATDGSKVYVAGSSTPVRYYSEQPSFLSGTGQLSEGGAVPVFTAIDNGYGNGTISAIDLKTGKIVWQYPTSHCTFVSPLVTNGVVFSGQLTDQGKPYTYSDFGGPVKTPLLSSGMLMALDANNGNLLWQYNVGAQVGIGGPSIGNGYLLVPTGGIQENNNGGYVIAFGLPSTTPPPVTTTQTPAPPTTTKAGMLPVAGLIAVGIIALFVVRKKNS